ncbi:DUF5977 domain-containing protein [Foetidibacter luteolus]|uniref:DUF5977 domain-containing protein n=1 Tax=Foetidibacter luteolus TaxID=2608880 RepID=UPI00129A13CB|nr:DUF5977 domain-containing protein [Foetidibacter luteolus]
MKLIISFLLTFFSATILAQDDKPWLEVSKTEFKAKQVIPPSPDAAELGKYGNVPVSLFTGTPNISIPLMELKGRLVSLPVSLNYNATGFKPEEIASWVGLGWTLNAGGVITRSVLGNPDIANNYFTNPSPFERPLATDVFGMNQYYTELRDGLKETQPDTYYFNFMGRSGKFIINPDGTIAKKEKDMLAISHCITCENSSFTIIDEQGTKYTFAERETTRITPSDDIGADQLYFNFTSSWYLSSVESSNGKEKILFTYHSPAAEQNTSVHELKNQAQVNTYKISSCHILNELNPELRLSREMSYSSSPFTYIKRKFLQSVNLTKDGISVGYLDFESLADSRTDLREADFSGERVLKKVKLYSAAGGINKLIKQFDLTQGYFGSGNTQILRLESLKETAVDASTTAKPPYQFDYENGATIPKRFTAGVDHWGFYNGTSNAINGVETLIPEFTVTDPAYGILPGIYGRAANRNADFTGSVTTVLRKIVYPTGGYTSFEYESHDFNNEELPYDNKLGGIRVKTITDYSFETNKATVKNYEYKTDDGKSSGKTGEKPKYETFSAYDFYTLGCWKQICARKTSPDQPDLDINCFNYSLYTLTLSATPVFGLGTVQGSHIGYTRVVEYQNDAITGEALGKTVYKYKVVGFHQYDDDINNGNLLEQELYDNEGKLLKHIINEYSSSLNGNVVTIRKITPKYRQDNKTIICKKSETEYVNYATYQSSLCTTERRILPRGTQYMIEDYGIAPQQKLMSKQTEILYDATSGSYLTSVKEFDYGNPNHIYPTLITQTANNNEIVVTSVKYTGDYNASGSTGAAASISSLVNKNIKGAEVEKLQYRENISGGNRRYINGSITTYEPDAALPKSIMRLEIQAPLSSITSSSVNGGAFTYDNRYKDIAVFGYDNNGNINSQSKKDDAITSYLWDASGSYPIATVLNSDANSILYSSFELNESAFSWLLDQVSFNTSYSVTGKRSCVFVSGSKVYKLYSNPLPLKLKLSYWSRNGAVAVKRNGASVSSTQLGAAHMGWMYYEHLLPAGTLSIELSSANATIDELRLYPENAQMTTFTYEPMVGVNSQCDVVNRITKYDYDGYNRLVNVIDDNGNILKNYVYNYGLGSALTPSTQSLFYSPRKYQNFTRNTACPVGASPQTVTYVVPFGKYVSTTSANALAKAQQDIVDNGQNYANQFPCLYYNTAKTIKLQRNNCIEDVQGIGLFYNFYLAAGVVSAGSPEELAIAEQNYINTIGQNTANENAGCSCLAENKKIVNGSCEISSSKVYVGSSYANGIYTCSYRYVFTDGTASAVYTETSTTPCPQSN